MMNCQSDACASSIERVAWASTARAIRREPAIDIGEKVDAFEPPVPEQLRVEWGGHDALARLAAGARRRGFSQHTGKMVRVVTGGGLCGLWVVLPLGAEIHLRAGHTPQPQSVGPANLVELEVPLVAGIALRPAPDLSRRARVAHQREEIACVAVGRRDPVGSIGRPATRLRLLGGVWISQCRPAMHEM